MGRRRGGHASCRALPRKGEALGRCAWLCALTLPPFLQCLCLSPTYELALQTGKVIEQMGQFYPALKLAYAVRGNKCECLFLKEPSPEVW